jgi:hypothetical protein
MTTEKEEAPSDSKTVTQEIAPVKVTIIGTGTGDGGVLPPRTLAVTPDHLPNLMVRVISPLMAITVRFVNLFLTTFVGLVVAGVTPEGGKLLYTSDFFHLVLTCASLSIPGAAIGLFKDLITVFGRLEGKYPLATGQV